MTSPQPVNKRSADLTAERIAALQDLIPEAFTEGRVDFTKLREALGDIVDDGPERYNFTWAGKHDAIRALQAPTSATLVPCQEESVNWDTTQHLIIEGDNLEVLKLLYKSYFGKVKLIYIDPPYNTGNDFIYPDNYMDPMGRYLQITGQMDAEGNHLTSNKEASGRYHSRWLCMMYPRLFLARQLLQEDGAIFVSIDDNEAPDLRLLMNEIFGAENFVAQVVWQKKVSPANDAQAFSGDHDYILVFAKSATWNIRRLERTERQKEYYKNPDNDPRGPWNSATYTCNKSKQERPNLYYPITNPNTQEEIWPSETAVWAYSKALHKQHVKENKIYWGVDGRSRSPRFKTLLSEAGRVVPRSIWPYSEVGHTQEATQELMAFFPQKIFDTPKPTRLIQRILQIGTNPEDDCVVLDFFAGSGTLAEAVLRQNRNDGGRRKSISVQLPEPVGAESAAGASGFKKISDITIERCSRVVAELSLTSDVAPDEDLGFRVFKLSQSHFRDWVGVTAPTSDEYLAQMDAFADPLLAGFDPHSVVWEVAIKEGFALTSRIESAALHGHAVHRVTDTDSGLFFHICLDSEVDIAIVAALGLSQDDLFICRDLAIDDTTAANLALQCRLKTL